MSAYRELWGAEYDDIKSRILYEDNHYLIFNKRAGEIVQGDKSGDECIADILKAYIANRDSKPGAVFMGVAHRIDRPVSGLVLFAKTSKGLQRMNALIREGGLKKTYLALLCSFPPAESSDADGWVTLRNWLVRNPKQNKTYIHKSIGHSETQALPSGCKEGILKYKLICATNRYYLVEVLLLTGRHHQIRAQMAGIGCPIKGDLKYGAPRSNSDGSISLHAYSLEFNHPIGEHKKIKVTAPLSGEMARIVGADL